jgi:hypothetical protein
MAMNLDSRFPFSQVNKDRFAAQKDTLYSFDISDLGLSSNK